MKKTGLLILLVSVLTTVSFLKSLGQTSSLQLLLTWQAKSYVPHDFPGKVLPGANSQISASVELVEKGKLADLSRQIIYWYANEEFVGGGEGIQRTTFNAPNIGGKFLEIRVQLPNYKGNFLIKSTTVPTVSPQAVIEAPMPQKQFSKLPIQLKGTPYFFNIENPDVLNFSWEVNGKKPPGSENPDALNIDLNPDAPSGSILGVTLNIQNPNDLLEAASQSISLIFNR